MASPIKIIAQKGSVGAGVEKLRPPANGTIESEKARLRKATKEFESFFIYQMLKTMRQTIPENSLSGETALSGGMGKDAFTEIFDMEIARKATFGGHNSISELLYRSMEKMIDAQFEQKPNVPTLKPLKPPAAATPVKPKPEIPLPSAHRRPEMVSLDRPKRALPPSATRRIVQGDPIIAKYGRLIDKAARETQLDSVLIASVIKVESSGNPHAVSPSGAKGLMQLADSTSQDLKVADPFDPAENIRAGSRYLRRLLDRFGDLKLALAAYNAGPANVERHDGIPPFKETREYVRRVTETIKQTEGK
ncbi:MAG: transglycosylase SLT domain-containing protein [Candidatus Zixiibacteriota bacterium]